MKYRVIQIGPTLFRAEGRRPDPLFSLFLVWWPIDSNGRFTGPHSSSYDAAAKWSWPTEDGAYAAIQAARTFPRVVAEINYE